MEEQWREIRGFEGLYEVSSIGRVRSVDRRVPTKKGSRFYVGVERKQSIATNGYKVVSLSKGGIVRTESVHVLVAMAFVEHPGGNVEVCHNDGNRLNNSALNLRWGTRLENLKDKALHGTDMNGARCPQSRLNEEKVSAIKALLLQGKGQTELGKMFSVAPETINSIKSGKSWKHVQS